MIFNNLVFPHALAGTDEFIVQICIEMPFENRNPCGRHHMHCVPMP